ncbi:MAG: hypothetical protein HRT72_08410, partial [Flavobacteriales bacterium]|nr:hypothetical protein [Flavobacteriales bacterium]
MSSNLKKFLSLLTVSLFFSFAVFGQEICNNGIDDDNDGFVDLNDPDCPCGGGVLTVLDTGLVENWSMEHMSFCNGGIWEYNDPLAIDGWPAPANPGDLGSTDQFSALCTPGGDQWYDLNVITSAEHALPINQPLLGNVYQGAQLAGDWREYMSFQLHTTMPAGVEHFFNFWTADRAGTANIEQDNGCELPVLNGPIDLTLFGHETDLSDGNGLGAWASGE